MVQLMLQWIFKYVVPYSLLAGNDQIIVPNVRDALIHNVEYII